MLTPIPLQRLEGLAFLVISLYLFASTGESWWLFGLLILLPDLSMIGYAGGPVLGARIYNLGHALLGPAALLVWSITTPYPLATALGAIWLAHIGVDRAAGYGLKLTAGFKHTHLGVIGRPAHLETEI